MTTPANDVTLAAANQDRVRQAEEDRQAKLAASHWTGSKHIRGRDLVEVAKDVRADIKAASRSGVLRGIKATVRVHRYSMGQTLIVRVTEIPAGVVVLSTRRIREDMGLAAEGQRMTPWRSHEGAAIIDAVEKLANAYNYDNSDTMTDLYRQEFHLDVAFDSNIQEGQRRQIEAAIRGTMSA